MRDVCIFIFFWGGGTGRLGWPTEGSMPWRQHKPSRLLSPSLQPGDVGCDREDYLILIHLVLKWTFLFDTVAD